MNNSIFKFIGNVFKRDHQNYEGVYRINIYLLRLLFFLIIIFVGPESWHYIFNFKSTGDHVKAAAYAIWASYSVLAIIGFIKPLLMIPIVLLEILYKLIWLTIVAYPLWSSGKLIGSPAEEMTFAFVWVILAIIAVPWKYIFRKYILIIRKR